MSDEDPAGTVSPVDGAQRAARTARWAYAAAAVLGLPLAGLAYKLGAPALASVFKEPEIKPFNEVPPEPKAQLAMPISLPAPAAAPADSTSMIAREPPTAVATTAPPPAPPRPETKKEPEVMKQELPPEPPPWAVATAPKSERRPVPHLRVKSFREQEAEQQPTMFLMNLYPQQEYNAWTAKSEPQGRPAAARAAQSLPQSSYSPQTQPAPAAPAPKAEPAKPKLSPIPLHPAPKLPSRWPGQAAVTPQTSETPSGDPARFQLGAPSVSLSLTQPVVYGTPPAGLTGGAPDQPPPPNPPLINVNQSPLPPIPQKPPPRTPDRAPGQAPPLRMKPTDAGAGTE